MLLAENFYNSKKFKLILTQIARNIDRILNLVINFGNGANKAHSQKLTYFTLGKEMKGRKIPWKLDLFQKKRSICVEFRRFWLFENFKRTMTISDWTFSLLIELKFLFWIFCVKKIKKIDLWKIFILKRTCCWEKKIDLYLGDFQMILLKLKNTRRQPWTFFFIK